MEPTLHYGVKRSPARDGTGSVIVVVMITLLFAAAALVAFIEKAANDLLVEARLAEAARLRPDAYSALEMTLGVLDEFRQIDNGLHHPSEGWSDPLGWAGWTPPDGNTVDVSFEDESGKIPLHNVNSTYVLNLFEYWGMPSTQAQQMTDEIMSWMQQSYSPVTVQAPDYEQNVYPFDPPYRSMRSVGELAAIDLVRDYFYTNGQPNAWWWRFNQDFSLFNYSRPNINGANSDVLTAVGQFSADQMQSMAQYLAGTSNLSTVNRTWFQNGSDITTIIGRLIGNASAFTTTVSALRINITVHDGRSQYRLSVVVSSAQGGANTVVTTATDVKQSAANASTGEANNATQVNPTAQPTISPTSAQTSAAQSQNTQYPFRILDIRENEDIPVAPPAPPPDPTIATSAPPSNPFSAVVPPLPSQ